MTKGIQPTKQHGGLSEWLDPESPARWEECTPGALRQTLKTAAPQTTFLPETA